MNHSINNDKSEKTLSVTPIFLNGDRSYASRKNEFDNDANSEHIYENVPRKRKSLSELMVNLKLKTRDLSLRKYAKKLKPKMIENRKVSVNDAFVHDESSYTSCNEENIYENLDFSSESSDETVELENYALKTWLHSLSMEVEDYNDVDFMITKCVPSKQNSTCDYHNVKPRQNDVTVTHAESELDKFKLDVLKKCFSAIWRQESENEILGGLYVFLNDIFATYFRKSRVAVVKSMETREGADECRSVDKKKTVQKLETFILSFTLNRLTITYNRSLKFYFALESSQFFVDAAPNSVWKFSRFYVNQNCENLRLKNKKDLKSFLRTFKLVLVNYYRDQNRKAIKQIDDVVESTSVIEENIYEPIWDCVNRYESLYEPLNFRDKTVRDDEFWILDAEFRYLPKHKIAAKENMFKTVQIIHRVNSVEKISLLSENDATSLSSEMIQSSDLGECDSVRAWKELLRSPFYNEDEEEFLMTETQIVALKLFEPEYEETSVFVASHDEVTKNEMMSNGSYELKSSISESSLETSIEGKYRNVNENDSQISIPEIVEPVEEPKKERERFRDKISLKFKLKSNKTASPTPEHVEISDEDFFGGNLETVEKDTEFKNVPKLVTETVQILEDTVNLSTAGIYRVSGNKTVIEALKKKINDKKSSKKESKNTLLRNQDVHTLAGMLKMFFRELKPPLMPSRIFNLCTSDNITSEEISSILEEMPKTNYETLKYVVGHLKRVELQKEQNLMNSGNLAICWGLCLFSSSFDASNQFFENDISKCNMLLKRMIDNFAIVFKI